MQPSGVSEGRTIGRRHRQSITAIYITDDDTLGFSASKDGMICQWNIETGISEKYEWPCDSIAPSTAKVGVVHGSARNKASRKGSKHVLALAVSSDGRYLASGGLDQAVHLWDTRTRQHLQVSSEALINWIGSGEVLGLSLDNMWLFVRRAIY